MKAGEDKLLKVRGLKVDFDTGDRKLRIIRGLDITVEKGQIVGILGESGSGKTVSASSIMQLFDRELAQIVDGNIIFKGKELIGSKESELEKMRGRQVSYIFQDPSRSLDPNKKIGKQLVETLLIHDLPFSRDKIMDMLREAGIEDPKRVYQSYPFELSGGQNQRVMICQSILCSPDLLIADEPTSSIDASLRKKILDLLSDINVRYHMSIILITHDFDLAKYICDHIVIMYGGLSVEEGTIEEVMYDPYHPYTAELIKCAASLDEDSGTLYTLKGMPVTPNEFRDACPFYERCSYRRQDCLSGIPEVFEFNGRKVRCLKEVVEMRAGGETG